MPINIKSNEVILGKNPTPILLSVPKVKPKLDKKNNNPIVKNIIDNNIFFFIVYSTKNSYNSQIDWVLKINCCAL